jgi:hypothetical protein
MTLLSSTTDMPQTADPAPTASDRVSDLIQKLVAAATADVESAAQRARAQAQVEITHLQKSIDRLRDDVQAERDRVKIASRELDLARATAAQLKEELNAERGEKARFAATLETVRLLVTGIDPEQGPDPTPLPAVDISEADDESGHRDAEAALVAEFTSGDLTLAATQPRAVVATPADAATAGHLAQLLGQIEEIYRSDLKLAEGTSEVVARLAANLAYARDALARRLDSTDGDDAATFDRHVAMLIDARSGTPFGRHLAMALRFGTPELSTSSELEKEAS